METSLHLQAPAALYLYAYFTQWFVCETTIAANEYALVGLAIRWYTGGIQRIPSLLEDPSLLGFYVVSSARHFGEV